MEKLRQKGKEVANEPVICEEGVTAWNGWVQLNEMRNVGFQVNPLSMSDIMGWIDLKQIYDPDEREETFDLIYEMDRTYIAWVREKDTK